MQEELHAAVCVAANLEQDAADLAAEASLWSPLHSTTHLVSHGVEVKAACAGRLGDDWISTCVRHSGEERG